MFKCYKIYTQRLHMRWMAGMISEYFGGFTIYRTAGYWNAKAEKSVVIEIITDETAAEYKIRQIALKIRGFNKQDAVMVTLNEVNMEIK